MITLSFRDQYLFCLVRRLVVKISKFSKIIMITIKVEIHPNNKEINCVNLYVNICRHLKRRFSLVSWTEMKAKLQRIQWIEITKKTWWIYSDRHGALILFGSFSIQCFSRLFVIANSQNLKSIVRISCGRKFISSNHRKAIAVTTS